METGSERQKMQRKGEAASENTRGNDSVFFPYTHGLRVRVDDASMSCTFSVLFVGFVVSDM